MFEVDATLIRRLVISKALTLRDFATGAQINSTTASRVLQDGATATLKTIGALAKYFGVEADALILKGR